MTNSQTIRIIGGGLAGCEAAWQLLNRGYSVQLYEQRPGGNAPAHATDNLAELVCSNSLRSNLLTSAAGMLKAEMRLINSLIISAADDNKVPAGQALAVDRPQFYKAIRERLDAFESFNLVNEEVTFLKTDEPTIVATGPLTSPALSAELARLIGEDSLYFYDSISPIIDGDSINFGRTFRQSRYGKGDGDDYINCPMNKEEYQAFIAALLEAEQYPTHEFEDAKHFEGCLPIEEMASRGEDVLRFGPMKPVGLEDPKTGREPYACVQLRMDDLAETHFNIVGFQTKMKKADQKRVFRMIPGLEQATFHRWGQMHRNSYIQSPRVLLESYQLKASKNVFVAGQLSGVEGYIESAASGIAAGIYMDMYLNETEIHLIPPTSATGALAWYICNTDPDNFQPMNITFGLVQQPGHRPKGPRRVRREATAQYGIDALKKWISETIEN